MSNRENQQMLDWQPSAAIATLKKRGVFLAKIRHFFAERNVLEVETPHLASASVSDVYLSSFSTQLLGPAAPEGKTLYLQTSPEFHMKRLLCAGSGCIYSLAKAFRNEEAGRHHNPEFTMLEWYRIDFDHFQLMDEIEALLQVLLACPRAERISYQQAFIQHLDCDPLHASKQELIVLAEPLGLQDLVAEESHDGALQLLFTMGVEPKIGWQRPCFIYDFPAGQASLARISADDPRVAERFELYYQGMELANGFHELCDAKEQAQRFAKDQQLRLAQGYAQAPLDQRFLAALAAGLPNCSGVAIGVDRLFMLAQGAKHIEQVLSFSVTRA